MLECRVMRGIFKSVALPGLWISPAAVEERDWWSVMATIERGITRKGHHEFMGTIWNKNNKSAENHQL